MTINDLEVLYDYGYWANKKLFQVISQLAPGEYAQPVAGRHSSIRNTLVHVLSAEWGWLERCGGPERGSRLIPESYPTLEALTETWNKVEGYVRGFLANLKDEDLVREIEFSIGGVDSHRMQLGQLMKHAAIHGVHHRAQVALLVRMLGYEPGNFDLLVYYAVTGADPTK